MILPELKANWRRVRESTMLFGVFATGVRVGANIVLLPLLISHVPTAELALWWVFLALGGFANLADFGFGPSIARVYTYLWAGAEDFDAEGLREPPKNRAPNLRRIRQLTSTVRFFYWRLSAAATLVLALIGTVSLLKSAGAAARPELVWLAWAGYLLTVLYGLGTSRWMLACQGLNRMRELQAAYLWAGLSYVACAAGLLLAGWGLLALVAANLLKGIITREYCRRVYQGILPRDSAGEPRPEKDMLRRLWPNAWKLGAISLGAFFLTYGNVLVCNQFLGDQITASFGLTAQVGVFVMSFSALWLNLKWPHLTILRTQGRLEEMSVLFARRLAFALATFAAMAVVVVWIGDLLLQWKGARTRLLPTPQLIFYLVYLGQQLFYVQFGALTYTENVVPFFKISLFTGLGMLALSLVLTPTLGLWGLLLAPLLAESAYSSWFTVRRGFSGQPLTARQLVRAALTGRLGPARAGVRPSR